MRRLSATCRRSATRASPSAAWSRSRHTRSSPASKEISTVRETWHATASARHHAVQQHGGVRLLGVTSFDSTSAFRQAFKDDRDNYHTVGPDLYGDPRSPGGRKPQTEEHASRQAGSSKQHAIQLEQACLRRAARIRRRRREDRACYRRLHAYEEIFDGRKDYRNAYREMLAEDAHGRTCPCGICAKAGINVIIFRGSERNKRRGFHNIYAFRQRLDRELRARSAA